VQTTDIEPATERLLHEYHRENFTRPRGISDDAAKRHGLYTETNYAKLAAMLGWKRYPKKMGPAVVIPYPDAAGNFNGYAKLRPDNPRQRLDKPVKYEAPKGHSPRPYLPHGISEAIETGGELTITEGEAKAIAATEAGFPTIGLSGVYGFCRKGVAGLPTELEAIAWKGRRVYVAFDSDREEKEQVRQAESRLAAILTKRGAIVRVVLIPSAENGEKQGLDDFLVASGPAAFRKLLDHAEEPEPEDAISAKLPAKDCDSMPEARRMVANHCRDSEGRLIVRFHQGDFWKHDGRKYRLLTIDDVRAGVVEFLDESYFGLKTSVTSNVVECLKSVCNVSDLHERPVWLGEGTRKPNWLPMRNGLVDIEAIVGATGTGVRPLTPEYFSTVSLPYDYDPEADCPIFRNALRRSLSDDPQRILLLQEFVGSCLEPNRSVQRFLMFYGEGATGKSAILAAFNAMLGRENVSAVPLERFGERFALFGMLGKLANIAAEIGEIDRVAEGYLKALTSGDLFEFERKHRDPVFALPTARLIFSTNNLPRFADRSGGLWRRLVLMPFNEVIPEGDRVIGMDRPSWWEASGELPGILNWALIGLRRLREQGRFTESAVVNAMLAEYRRESNPAQTFLLENYRAAEYGQEPKQEVFNRYLDWCQATNHRALTDGNFAKELIRTFPAARDERPRIDGGRVRCWVGIARGADDEPDPDYF